MPDSIRYPASALTSLQGTLFRHRLRTNEPEYTSDAASLLFTCGRVPQIAQNLYLLLHGILSAIELAFP
jgi:hypothetical protein